MSLLRLSALLLPVSLVPIASAQSVLLRYRPPVGKTVAYTVSMSMTMSTPQKTPGTKGPMSIKQTMPMTIRVVSRTADLTTVETKTGSARFGVGSPMAGAPQAKPVVMRMTIDQFGTPKGGAAAGPAAAMMNSMGGSTQGVLFPRGPVKVGDTWTQSIDMGKVMSGAKMTGMKMQGKFPLVYRLTAYKGGIVTIVMTSKGKMTMAMGTQPINANLNMRSTVLIDAATGLMKSMATVNDSDTMIPGMGAMRQHMTISIK